MSEPMPLLDGESPWPVSTGTLGRTYATTAVGPGEAVPDQTWSYEHDAGLVAPPVVTRAGEVVLLDVAGGLSLLSADGEPGWSVALDVAPVEAHNSPAVWRRDGRTLISVSYEGGVLLVEPGDGVVEDVPVAPPGRFLCLREVGPVTWSREAVSLLDDGGELLEEHRFVWRSDDVACPTVGPDGAVYFLENREYAPSWDAEDQYLEVARVTFDGGAARESVFAAHAHTTDAVGSLCATEQRLVWILDSWRLGYSAYDGQSEELNPDAFADGNHPSRILGGRDTTAILQREEEGQPVYALAGAQLSTWPIERPVAGAVIDAEGAGYLLADGRLHGVSAAGDARWTSPAAGGWVASAGDGRLLVGDRGGSITGYDGR